LNKNKNNKILRRDKNFNKEDKVIIGDKQTIKVKINSKKKGGGL